MPDLGPIGKMLIIAGLLLVILGALLVFSGRLPWLGRLPGDIFIKKKDFTFYFPLGTSIVLSLILSLILWLINRK